MNNSIIDAVLNAERAHGRGFIAPPLTSETRSALEALAVVCGASNIGMHKVSDADLVALYSVARRKAESGPQVAARINRKYALQPGASAVASDPEPIEPATPFAAPAALSADELASIVRELDERVDSKVALALRDQAPLNIIVTSPNLPEPVALGIVHHMTPRVLRALGAGLHVYLYGPAGSGKTTMAGQCAKALGVQFYTAAKVESEYALLGFKDARGETVRTQFRDCFEHGGLFLFDEMDRSSPSAIVAMNMALANGLCAFPDGIVTKHENCYVIGAGNTALTGQSRQYSSAMAMDASSVDRFYFLPFGYDEKLELALASDKRWARHVQAIRGAVADRGLTHLVTPRATLDGCKALAAGDSWTEAEDAVIFKGLDTDTADQLRAAVRTSGNNAVQAA